MKRPAIYLVLCWIIGYILAMEFSLKLSGWLTVFFLFLLLISWVLQISGRAWISLFLVIGIAAGYSHWVDAHNLTQVLPPSFEAEQMSGSTVHIEGLIDSAIQVDGDHVLFQVKAKQLEWEQQKARQLSEKMQVSLRLLQESGQNIARKWKRGDYVSFSGTLYDPSQARNFGGFSYRGYLRLQHIHWLLSVKGISQVEVHPLTGWHLVNILRWNDELRSRISQHIQETFSKKSAGIIESMLIGNRNELDPTIFQQFSQLGLSHILAISGLHVALVLGSLMWLLRRIGLTKETNLQIAMIFLPLYILLTGSAPSVVRAGIMGMIGLYAAKRNLLKDGIHIVSITAVLMLIWNPYYLYSISFQLSFLVTIGLILGVPRVRKLLPITNKVLNGAFAVAITAQLIAFPISIYYFNQLSLLSLFANIVLVPIMAFIILPFGIVAVIASLISIRFGIYFAWIPDHLLHMIFKLIETLNQWQLFQTIWPKPAIGGIIVYYVLLGLMIRSLIQIHDADKKGLISLLAIVTLLVGLLYFGYSPDIFKTTGTVDFIDVGQGDAIFIHSPEGKNILIDGGGTFHFQKWGEEWKTRRDPYDVGSKLLVPLLKQRGVHQIDYLIATHDDADHIEGFLALLNQIPVKNVIFDGLLKESKVSRSFFQIILRRKIPLLVVTNNHIESIDKHTFIHFIEPVRMDQQHPKVKISNVQNNDCLVFVLQMYKTRFLFTGDMEIPEENAILYDLNKNKEDEKKIAPVDIIKIAHHGSKTSSSEDWLNYWQPKIAIISVGAQNRYGHPSGSVITRLFQHHFVVYRTDQNGEIQISVNARKFQVKKNIR